MIQFEAFIHDLKGETCHLVVHLVRLILSSLCEELLEEHFF
jgi:hypothetical protein